MVVMSVLNNEAEHSPLEQ